MKRKKGGRNVKIKETLYVDEVLSIHRKKGNGIIKRQIWVNAKGEVTRYSLAYINHRLFNEDNGRVLGYDNAHGFHHKHYKGQIEPITFQNFTELENLFQQEFEVLHEESKKER